MTNDVNRSFYNEVWKDVVFEGDYTNKFGLQVSDYGRVRSTNLLTGKPVQLLAGSLQEGYVIIRKKLFTPQLAAARKKLDAMREEIAMLSSELNSKAGIEHNISAKELKDRKRKYANAMHSETKKRTTNIGLLVHRMVADFWCDKPSADHVLVIHKDFNKVNNHYTNLQWATMSDSIAHQQLSPNMIAEKAKRKDGTRKGNQKLTVIRVMLIKKRLLEGRTMRQLAKQFKVTETQIARIKKGENWANVPAAS